MAYDNFNGEATNFANLLKPCPFCGKVTGLVMSQMDECEEPVKTICCRRCSCGIMGESGEDWAEITEKWNRRAAEDSEICFKPKIDFYDYMMKNHVGDSAFGDLAEDMARMEKHYGGFPRNKDASIQDGFSLIRWHLICHNACKECLEVFDAAYVEYAEKMRQPDD